MAIEKFTLIGATTRFGMLTPPMRARFGIVHRLNYYPAEDLELIVTRIGGCDRRGGRRRAARWRSARRARGTPRVANRLLRRVRDYAQVKAQRTRSRSTWRRPRWRCSKWMSSASMTWTRACCGSIIEKFDGGPVGINTIAAAVGEDANTIEEVYEPFLVQNGFLQRTPRGRMATPQAYRHFGYSVPRPGESDQRTLL